jgi:tetratricopeptide (TPR) repeat protein
VDQLRALEEQAVAFAKRGDFGLDARTVNEEITKLAPANHGAWTRLARCCLELGLLDDATAALDTALQLNPQNTIARNLLIEVSRRRAGPAAAVPAPRKRASSAGGVRTAAAAPAPRRSKSGPGSIALGGVGRAEFAALGHLPPQAAAESLTPRLEPLLMALNDRPFAARVVDARNRAAHAGVRMFRRGSIVGEAPGHIGVFQQGGRWEPQMNIGMFAAAQWRRDALSAGIGFNLATAGEDDKSDAGRERAFNYFNAFQQLLATTWRQHLTDWLRANGGFIQLGEQPPATDVLPAEAVSTLISADTGAAHSWIFCGRWLFMDRGEDAGILGDAPRLLRWLEQTFSDLLPLWGDVYREAYRSSSLPGNSQRGTGNRPAP